MFAYFARRLALAVFTLWAVTVLSFIIIQLPPGDFVDAYMAQLSATESNVSEQQMEALRKRAAERNIALIRTPMGFGFAPVAGDQIIKNEVFEKLPKSERERIETDIETFQKELLGMVFDEGADVAPARVEKMIRQFVKRLRDGEMDKLLVYRKALRKDVKDYTKTTPPHVKAARQLGDWTGRIVSYVMTTQGPQPAQILKAPPDYEHYVEKQIRPVAEAILQHLGLSWERIWSPQDELPF